MDDNGNLTDSVEEKPPEPEPEPVMSHAFNPKARKRQSFKLCKYFLLN